MNSCCLVCVIGMNANLTEIEDLYILESCSHLEAIYSST